MNKTTRHIDPTARGRTWRWRRLRVLLAVATLLAMLLPATAATAADGTAQVNVYFTPAGSECDATNPYTRTVATPAVLLGAMQALLEGPTAQEAPLLATDFSSATAGMVNSVDLRDNVAYVDFADLREALPGSVSSCMATSIMEQLNATARQFPAVLRTRYSINGSRADFYNWLGLPVPGDSTELARRGSLSNTREIRKTDGGLATLIRMRAARRKGFDRLVFEFDGDLPSYRVAYTAVAREGGSGRPIAVGGNTALQIDLVARTIDTSHQGFERTFSPSGLAPGYPTLRKVRYGGEFEAVSTFGAGLKGRTGFRVIELANPTRIAIDVAHGAKVRQLRRGHRGADVRDWKRQLNTVQRGFFASSARPSGGPLSGDAVFGRRVTEATKVLQRAEGVRVTGVVNGATRAAMRSALWRSSQTDV